MIRFVINPTHTRTRAHTPPHYRHLMPVDLTYHLNPIYIWAIFMVFNLIQPLIFDFYSFAGL